MQNFSTEILLEKIAVVFGLLILYNIIFSCCSVCVLFCRQSSLKGYGKQLYRNCIFLSSHGKFYVIITSLRKRKPASQKLAAFRRLREHWTIYRNRKAFSVQGRGRPAFLYGIIKSIWHCARNRGKIGVKPQGLSEWGRRGAALYHLITIQEAGKCVYE